MAKSVWYKSKPGVSVPAWEDRGELSVEHGTIRFSGKTCNVSGRIRSVGRTQMGMNRWVHVGYETDSQAGDAYFMDSGLLGWAGVLGGNKRLADELETSAHEAEPPPPPGSGTN